MKISEAVFTVLDTETTGLDAANGDRIVEFASRDSLGNEVEMLVNPGIPIPYEVSAIHHLTIDDVKDAATWEVAMDAIPRLITESNILVAHNAPFDRSFLPGLQSRRWLCTRRLARHLLPKATKHSNQVLRYYLGGSNLDLHGLAPHRALADVIVTQFVFGTLLNIYRDKHEDDVDALIAFADSPIRIETVPFGKHKGMKIESLPRSYVTWCLEGMQDLDPDLRLQFKELLGGRSG